MDRLKEVVAAHTVKDLQKFAKGFGINMRGLYKEEKEYYITLIIQTLYVRTVLVIFDCCFQNLTLYREG